ncbi:MAG: putative DNA repair protein MutK [Alteromonadaceae bacterium]
MAGSSLLTLIDDIATVLDDVAILSKVAVKKSAGVLGDDLALNAEQVSGVKADRELPVVWAVTKGSFVNKLILVPAALIISAFAPPLITVLLVIGGLFLCYEGAEKIAEKLLHPKVNSEQAQQQRIAILANKDIDLVALEKDKIKGAIRTDFVLSAEIVVIVLGSVKDASFEMQVMVISSMALLITVGVYGLVAAIVKLDDLGLYLLRKSVSGSFNTIQRAMGRSLLIFAPNLMKTLSVVGTIAMFLVGGGILVHSFSWLHQQVHHLGIWLENHIGTVANTLSSFIIEAAIGLFAGILVLSMFTIITRIRAALK